MGRAREVSRDCAQPGPSGGRRAVSHGPGPQAVCRRAPHSAGAARGGVVRREANAAAVVAVSGRNAKAARPQRKIWLCVLRGLCGLRSLSAAGGETPAEARLVPARGVLVDDALAGHSIDQRHGLLEGGLRAGQIVAVDRGADVAERVAQTRAELAVLLAVL